jgi:hypothetical protein
MAKKIGLLMLVLILSGCGPEAVLRLSTRIFPNGGIERAGSLEWVDAESYDAEQEPSGVSAMQQLRFDKQDGWRISHETPERVLATAFANTAADLPAGPRHRQGDISDRSDRQIRRTDTLLFTRWEWSERYGDPVGTTEIEAKLTAFASQLAETVRERSESGFGTVLDPSILNQWLGEDILPLLRNAIHSYRRAPDGWFEEDPRFWLRPSLESAGVAIAEIDPEDLATFWMAEGGIVLTWARDRLEQRLVKAGLDSLPDLLAFEREDQEELESLFEFVDDGPCPDESLRREACELLRTFTGIYGGLRNSALRFVFTVELPGLLLRTNGTAEAGKAIWACRASELSSRDLNMQAMSMEMHHDVLTDLGARHEWSAERLLQLENLFRDPEQAAALRIFLEQALAKKGDRSERYDLENTPEAFRTAATELANLLDPDVQTIADER